MLKSFLPRGRTPRTIQTGLLCGLRLHLDLRSELLIWLGLYERETFAAMRRLVRGCRGAIDLGAAKGDLSLWLLAQPEMGRVMAVEPLDREIAQLRQNLALNDRASDPRFSLHIGFAGHGSTPAWQTLDQLASGLTGPIFIKIDIDGPESEVLASGPHTLTGQDCRLLIETHSPEAEKGCLDQLTAWGYRTQIISPAWWRVIVPERRPIPHNRWLAAWRS